MGLILSFCNLNISKLLFEKAKNARNHIVMWLENSRKRGENAKMRGVFASKHRTSLRKTTALLMQNLGTLPQRSPMFLLFRRKNALKMPENVRKTADAPILRYFGPGQALVASMAFSPHYRSTSGRSKRRRKRQSGILHTPCSLLSFPRFAPLCEVASLSLYGLFSSITVTSCGNLPLWHVPSFGGKVQHVAGMEGGIQKKRLENKKTARPFAGRAVPIVGGCRGFSAGLSGIICRAFPVCQPMVPVSVLNPQ